MIPGLTGWENVAFPTTRSYTAFGLNGTKYLFRILAYTAIGWGPASTTVSAVPRSVPGAPFAVQATPGHQMVILEWSGTPNGGATIDGYRVQMAESLDGPWTRVTESTTFGPAGGGYGKYGLVNGKTYYFRVAADNAAGWGQYSWAVKAVPRTVPAAPGLTATPETPNWIKLNWTRPAQNGGAPIESYRFERAPGPNGPWTHVATTAVAADLATGHAYVGGLAPGTTYHFRAAAVNAAGQGPYTAAITATHTCDAARCTDGVQCRRVVVPHGVPRLECPDHRRRVTDHQLQRPDSEGRMEVAGCLQPLGQQSG